MCIRLCIYLFVYLEYYVLGNEGSFNGNFLGSALDGGKNIDDPFIVSKTILRDFSLGYNMTVNIQQYRNCNFNQSCYGSDAAVKLILNIFLLSVRVVNNVNKMLTTKEKKIYL